MVHFFNLQIWFWSYLWLIDLRLFLFICNPDAYHKLLGHSLDIVRFFLIFFCFYGLYIVNFVSKHMYIILIEKNPCLSIITSLMMMVIVVSYITTLLQAGITLLTSIYHLASLKNFNFHFHFHLHIVSCNIQGYCYHPQILHWWRGKRTVVT